MKLGNEENAEEKLEFIGKARAGFDSSRAATSSLNSDVFQLDSAVMPKR